MTSLRRDGWFTAIIVAAIAVIATTGGPGSLRAQAPVDTGPDAQPAEDREFPTIPSYEEFCERLGRMDRQLELLTRQNERLARQNRALSDRFEKLSHQSGASPGWDKNLNPGEAGEAADDDTVEPIDFETWRVTHADGFGDAGQPGSGVSTAAHQPQTAGGGSKAAGGDPTTTGRAQEDGNRHRGKLELNSSYDYDNDGFKFATSDDEFSLGIRGMEQLDGRIYSQPAPGFASSGIYNPRTRVYFEGHLTEPIQYEFSYQVTFDTINLLDAYINFSYDPRFQLRFGRYKTPFTYEWYRIHIWDLLSPERSLFATNFEGQRRFGIMGWGTLLENRIEYAVGSFDTQRNSYQAFNSLQDVMAFLNFKPFYNEERGFLLRDLQFGGSVNAGHENQPTSPAVLKTNAPPSAGGFSDTGAANSATVPFLAFNPGVTEKGDRALWELHAALYNGGLTLLGAWQGGIESYAKSGGPSHRIPINGWFVQAGYILTGETIRDRTLIDPAQPFDIRQGRFGLGALEPTARYSVLNLDRRVFTDGFADPNLWTNEARLVDVGLNWYLNKFVKIYFDWEHAMFASPVVSNGGRPQTSSDLYWLRTQVYF